MFATHRCCSFCVTLSIYVSTWTAVLWSCWLWVSNGQPALHSYTKACFTEDAGEISAHRSIDMACKRACRAILTCMRRYTLSYQQQLQMCKSTHKD